MLPRSHRIVPFLTSVQPVHDHIPAAPVILQHRVVQQHQNRNCLQQLSESISTIMTMIFMTNFNQIR